MNINRFLSVFFFKFVVYEWTYCSDELVIELTTGFIKGKTESLITLKGNLLVNVFLGIPFAEPPIDQNRFKAPIYKQRWDNLLYTLNDSPMCPNERNIHMSQFTINENCLYLDVYVPKINLGSLSVLLYFNESTFNIQPHLLVLMGDIIFVNIRYRSGILGYFTLGDLNAISNIGLRDQLMAIEWVKFNIGAFGGNSNDIVLLADSTSTHVGLHQFSPLSGNKNLFKSIILMNTSPLMPKNYYSKAVDAILISKLLANKMGCYDFKVSEYPNQEDYNKNIYLENIRVLKCMQMRNVYEILNAKNFLIKNDLSEYYWAPVIDGNLTFTQTNVQPFLPVDPLTYKDNSLLSKVNILIGTTTSTTTFSAWISDYNTWFKDQTSDFKDGFMSSMKIFLHVQNLTKSHLMNPKFQNEFSSNLLFDEVTGLSESDHLINNLILKSLYYTYVPWEDVNNFTATKLAFLQLLRDYYVNAPIDKYVKMNMLQGGASIFMYLIDSQNEYSDDSQQNLFDDMYYGFGMPFLTTKVADTNHLTLHRQTTNDQLRHQKISDVFMKHLVNFIKFGNPNQVTSERNSHLLHHSSKLWNDPSLSPINDNPYWPPIQPSHLYYMHIDASHLNYSFDTHLIWTLRENYRQTWAAFWNGYLPALLGDIDKRFHNGFPQTNPDFFYGFKSRDARFKSHRYNSMDPNDNWLNFYKLAFFSLLTICTFLIIFLLFVWGMPKLFTRKIRKSLHLNFCPWDVSDPNLSINLGPARGTFLEGNQSLSTITKTSSVFDYNGSTRLKQLILPVQDIKDGSLENYSGQTKNCKRSIASASQNKNSKNYSKEPMDDLFPDNVTSISDVLLNNSTQV